MYDRNELERIIPFTWEETYAWGIPSAEEIEEGMPRSTADPTRKNTHWAILADLRQAWAKADLTDKQRQAVVLRFGMDQKLASVAHVLGVSVHAVEKRIDGGVRKLLSYLNGLDQCEEIDD